MLGGGGGLEATTTLLCSAIVGTVAAAAGFIALVQPRQRALPWDLIVVLTAVGALAIIQLASMQWSVLPAASRTAAVATTAVMLAIWLGWFIRKRAGVAAVLHAFGIAVALVLISAIAIRSFHGDASFAFTSRLSDPVMHPNLLGAYAAVAITIGFFEALQIRRVQSLFGWAVVGLGAFVLPLTSSRSAEAIAVIVIIVLIAWRRMAIAPLLGMLIVIALSAGAGAWWSETRAFHLADFSTTSAGVGLALTSGVCVVIAVVVGELSQRLGYRGQARPADDIAPSSRRSRRLLYAEVSIALLFVSAAVVVFSLRVIAQGRDGAAWLSTAANGAGPQEGIRMSLSANNRDYWWYVAWKAFEAKPWIGWGAATFRPIEEHFGGRSMPTDSAHSIALDLLSGVGVLGFAAFLIVLFAMALRWTRCYSHSRGMQRDVLVVSGLLLGIVGLQSSVELTAYASPLVIPIAMLIGGWDAALTPTAGHEKIRRRLSNACSFATLVIGAILVASSLLGALSGLMLASGLPGTSRLSETERNELAMRADPFSAPAAVAVATSVFAQGDTGTAVVYLRRAIQLDPWNEVWRSLVSEATKKAKSVKP